MYLYCNGKREQFKHFWPQDWNIENNCTVLPLVFMGSKNTHTQVYSHI